MFNLEDVINQQRRNNFYRNTFSIMSMIYSYSNTVLAINTINIEGKYCFIEETCTIWWLVLANLNLGNSF